MCRSVNGQMKERKCGTNNDDKIHIKNKKREEKINKDININQSPRQNNTNDNNKNKFSIAQQVKEKKNFMCRTIKNRNDHL